MPPISRSSAPTTPIKSNVSAESPHSAGSRRTPRCTKCHRPRAGHPRSGCPYVDAPDTPSSVTKPALKVAQTSSDDGLLEELSSLQIVSPTEENRRASTPRADNKLRRRLSVRFALVPEQTLASLSATDAQLVEQLLQPGMLSDVVSPQDKVAHVLQWRKTLSDADPAEVPVQVRQEQPPARKLTPLSRIMPCTYAASTPSLTATEPVTDQGIGGSALDMNQTVYLLPDPRDKPPSRSMDFEQRSLFLQQLSRSSSTSPATLVSIPLADLDDVQSDAEKVGFHVRVLPGREDEKRWVILGTEQEAINILAEKFLEEEKRSNRVEGKGGRLTAVAGGVVFGAVATFTGLAFS